jgi:guanylate kinase
LRARFKINKNCFMSANKLIIFTAPSGAGKTTIVKHLLKTRHDLAFSISACTRPQRYGEINGMDYYFMSVAEFKKKIAQGDFLEWEEVYEGQFYGTLRSEVERLWAENKHVIFDIDVKGADNIKKKYKQNSLAVFVKTLSSELLFERLRNRKTEDNESLKKRISRVQDEVLYENRFDISLVNDVLEITLAQASAWVEQFIQTGKIPQI